MKCISFLFLFISFSICGQDIISEEIMIKNGPIKLPGTLSYPTAEEPIPLVLFVHGSGNIDRDGNQAGVNVKANYIKTLSDSLNQKGIAVYRYDKRTSNPENISTIRKGIKYEHLVSDVQQVIHHFKGDKRFRSITIIGHSQGSLTGMLALNDAVDRYISLAGLSESMDKAVIRQLSAQQEALAIVAKQHFEELSKTDTIQEVHPLLMALFAPQNHEFIQSYVAYNPTQELQKLKIPTLIINGDADLQVRVADAKQLQEAKPDAQLVIIPKMNHVLKEVQNIQENRQSYYDEKFPLSTVLVKSITDFVKQ